METIKNTCKCGCGEEIAEGRNYVSTHNLKRRPKDSLVINGRLYKEYTCEMCSEKFKRRADHLNANGNTHCKKCAHIHRGKMAEGRILESMRTGKEISCIQCNEMFYVSGFRLKKNAKYCSNDCLYEAQRIRGTVPPGLISSANNKGENNGMYKHGKRTGMNATGKKKLRDKVIARDGGDKCLMCGELGPGLHLHRIVQGSWGGMYELDNCVQLCAMDHEKVHSHKTKWVELLQKHIKEMGKFK